MEQIMGNFTQANKEAKAPAINQLAKEYGVKVSLGVKNCSTFVANINSGVVDFVGESSYTTGDGYIQVSQYNITERFTGTSKEFLLKLLAIMNQNNYDRSDVMTDYFDVGFYININIGRWNKPYKLTA
jgi:hypothetical protein